MASSASNNPASAKRYERPRIHFLPIDSCEEPLGSHYHIWWAVLIKKIYRLCTGGQEALVNSANSKLVKIKPSLDAWETALIEWLYEDWSKGLSEAQLEAIYSVLYDVAFNAFRLNVCPQTGQTCEQAVRETLSVTPEAVYDRANRKLWFSEPKVTLVSPCFFVAATGTPAQVEV
ncbi:hypothetical protein C6P46_001006 [Rhodotorula mucilaginosa]|uniref:Uncharacterized protein n=1 Tax=Rhodotorula mucilaginosa TaxID=5537 RepID=A0A9P6VVU7_RHOMI|nr:hypothetical protein C6P46_001006 [Rhodotorula mucilaginosa]